MSVSKALQFFITMLALASMLLFTPGAHAVRLTDLYEASVPVADQSVEARAIALKKVLNSIVIKVTGQSFLPQTFLQQSLNIQHMVEQFGYESRQASANSVRQLFLRAKFNSTSVKQLIRQADLPIWPEERPATLIWLAVDDHANRLIVAEDSVHPVVDQLAETASLRGLPVILPLMDLQESSEVDFEAIAAMKTASLLLPSSKYDSQLVLVGYIQRIEGEMWRARWQILGEEQRVATTPVGPLADVMAAGINPLASRIAEQFSSYSYVDSEQYIELAIDDIHSAEQYARSLKYLQSLSLVSQVDVVGVEPRAINFRLHTRADLASVLKVIDLGRVLHARDTIDQLVFGLNP